MDPPKQSKNSNRKVDQQRLLNRFSEFNILYLNIRSLSKHFDELKHLIDGYNEKPLVICLTETWLAQHEPFEMFQLKDYKLIISANTNKCNGVAMYINHTIGFEDIEISSNTFSSLTIKCYNNDNLLVSCIYKSPRTSQKDFLESFDDFIGNLQNHKCRSIIVGDFNIDLLHTSPLIDHYKNILSQNGYIQCLDEPTRIVKHSKTLIDHVIHNEHIRNINFQIEPYDITDHFAITISLPWSTKLNHGNNTRKIFPFLNNSCQMNEFLETLEAKLSDFHLTSCVSTDVKNLIELLKETIDEHTIISESKYKLRQNSWFSNALKNLINKRKKLLSRTG